jgi:HK97 gp10 family phage protein
MPSAIKQYERGFDQLSSKAIATMRQDLDDIRRRMKSMRDERTTTNIMRTSVLAGARVVRDRARENVVERTGELKRSIIARTRRRRRGEDAILATTTINPKSRSRHIAHLVEHGTEPHEIKSIKAVHPGAEPHPFMRPAIDENPDEILQAILDKARERLEKVNV